MNAHSSSFAGPHQAIATDNARDRWTCQLFDRLWDRYRRRVEYVARYEEVVKTAGATFVNDHIAFRTLACQQPLVGIACLSRIFDALGYEPAGCYTFPDKHLTAIHYQHPHPQFPKLFISELKTWELEPELQQRLQHTVRGHRPPLTLETLSHLRQVADLPESAGQSLLETVVDWIETLPWEPPRKAEVEAANRVSQYAAWVLVHGYNVNHFTSLINSHAVDALDSIDKTVAALAQAGVPMKAEIEGELGSKLRQSATEAVMIEVPVKDEGQGSSMPWTYAYFELAERGQVVDPVTGGSARFEGFLGPQATQLFEMTRVK